MDEELDEEIAFEEDIEYPAKQDNPPRIQDQKAENVSTDMSKAGNVPVCLTTYEEINSSESETESDDSSEEIRDGVDRIRIECGEHSSLKRLGQKMKESMISLKNKDRKISIKSVKV